MTVPACWNGPLRRSAVRSYPAFSPGRPCWRRSWFCSPATRQGHGDGGHGQGLTADIEAEIEDDGLRRKATRVTWLGVGANVCLTGLKGAAGYASGSTGLMADAVHNMTDLAGDAVSLLTLRVVAAPADEKYPYGYGKYDAVGTLGVAGILLVTAGEILHQSLESLLEVVRGNPCGLQMAPMALGVVVVCVAVKEILFRITLRVGKEARSSVVIANAWHHRSDALSSLVVMGGIGGVMVGLPYMDAVGGVMVAGYTAKQAVEIGWGAVKGLTDQQTDTRLLHGIREVGDKLMVGGIITGLSKVRVRHFGAYCLVDLNVIVDPFLSVGDAHKRTKIVRRAIQLEHPEVHEVLAHVCPSDVQHD